MLDELVKVLNQYSETEFINITLKREFFSPHFSMMDMRVPLSALGGETYTLYTDSNYDWVTDTIYDAEEEVHEFVIFLRLQLIEDFNKFKVDLFNQCKFEPNKDRRNYFIRFTYLQLQKEILPKIQANNSIKETHKEVILKIFNEELKKFKHAFKISLDESVIVNTKVKSFKYNSIHFDYNLSQLFYALKDGDLISKNTLKSDFSLIFSHVEVVNKITWTGTKSEFYYFITQINNLKDFTDFKSKKWEMASSCFLLLDKKGLEIDWRKFRSWKKPNAVSIRKIDNYLKL